MNRLHIPSKPKIGQISTPRFRARQEAKGAREDVNVPASDQFEAGETDVAREPVERDPTALVALAPERVPERVGRGHVVRVRVTVRVERVEGV